MNSVAVVYGLYMCDDMDEGRGQMRLVSLFAHEDDAWKAADTMPGIMGRTPGPGGWRNSKFGEINVSPLTLYADYEAYTEETEREIALGKLTPREREILGL